MSNEDQKVTDERERLIEAIGSLRVGDIPHEIRNFLGFAATGVIADFILADRKRILDKVDKAKDAACDYAYDSENFRAYGAMVMNNKFDESLDQIREEEL